MAMMVTVTVTVTFSYANDVWLLLLANSSLFERFPIGFLVEWH